MHCSGGGDERDDERDHGGDDNRDPVHLDHDTGGTDIDDEGDVEDVYDHHDHNESPNLDNGEEGLANFDDHDHHKLEYMRKTSPRTPWSRGRGGT